MSEWRSVWLIPIGIYFLWGILLIAQKPGLQYDEALIVADAVPLRHAAVTFALQQVPDSWVCPFGRCIPLMSAYYVGAVKAYAALPFFLLFGPRTPLIRLVSLLLGALGIWGIYRLAAAWFGPAVAFIAAFGIAINPSFINLVVFDNNAAGAVAAGLGLTCAAVASYAERKTFLTAFTVGAAIGFDVWARANLVWVLAAGVAAGLIIFRRQMLVSVRHWMAIVLGGIAGGFPFLVFQALSRMGTWRVQDAFAVSAPLHVLLLPRVFMFAETLLSDGENRAMWAGPALPSWQLLLFPLLVALSCIVCLLGVQREDSRRRSFAQFASLTLLFASAFLFFSHLQVAEHHFIMVLPLCVLVVVVACAIFQARFPWARALSAALLLIYCGSAFYWQVAAVRGLRNTGGIGVWSDAGLQLAHYLDQTLRGREIKFLDWGLEYNMYVLTDGRMKSRSIYAPESGNISFDGRPWIDEIRDGGVFVLNGPENRQFPLPSAGFLRALAAARPEAVTHRVEQRNGATYAEVIEIKPGTSRQPARVGEQLAEDIALADTRFDSQLSGFYPPEGRSRWTKREFSATLGLPDIGVAGALLTVQLYIPDSVLRKIGPITLEGRIDGHSIGRQTWSQAGQHVYSRELPAAWLTPGRVHVDFTLDKALAPSPSDRRELGIIVTEISLRR